MPLERTNDLNDRPGGRRWKRFGPTLILVLLSISLTLTGGEILCRLAEGPLMKLRWDWRESCRTADDPELIYTLRPNLVTRIAGTPFETDSRGERLNPGTDTDTRGRPVVAVVGDSLAAGFGVGGESCFPFLIQDYLSRSPESGGPYQVRNFGVPGYNLEQITRLVENAVADGDPCLVMLCLFVNDLEGPFLTTDEQGELKPPRINLQLDAGGFSRIRGWFRVNSYLYRFLGSSYDALLRATGFRPREDQRQRERHDRLWTSAESRDRLNQSLLRAREVVSATGGDRQLIVTLLPALFQLTGPVSSTDRPSAIVAEACQSLQIPFINVIPALASIPDPTTLYLGKDPHPSEAGHKAIARALAGGLHEKRLLPGAAPNRGGWTTPDRITRTAGDSHTSAVHNRSLAFDRTGTAHLVWFDDSGYGRATADPAVPAGHVVRDRAGYDPVYEIYYTRFAGDGWAEPERLSPLDNCTSRSPDLSLGRDGRLHLFYSDERSGIMAVYHRELNNRRWLPDQRVSQTERPAYKAASALDSQGTLHLAYPCSEESRRPIHYTSREAGSDWSAAETVGGTPPGGFCFFPIVIPDNVDGTIHLFWKMTSGEAPSGIYYRKRHPGDGWFEQQRLTPVQSVAAQPSAWPAEDGGAHLVWVDHRHGRPEIYYCRVSAPGPGPGERVTIHPPTDHDYQLRHPSVAAADGRIHLAWSSEIAGNHEIYSKVRQTHWWAPTRRITWNSADSKDVSIYPAPDGGLHLVWDENRDGNFEIYHSWWRTHGSDGS